MGAQSTLSNEGSLEKIIKHITIYRDRIKGEYVRRIELGSGLTDFRGRRFTAVEIALLLEVVSLSTAFLEAVKVSTGDIIRCLTVRLEDNEPAGVTDDFVLALISPFFPNLSSINFTSGVIGLIWCFKRCWVRCWHQVRQPPARFEQSIFTQLVSVGFFTSGSSS